MLGLLKLFFYVGLLIAFVWFGRSVPIGKHTLFGHVERIWATEATQDLVDGAKTSAGPALERIKRGVEAGVEAAEKTRPDAGVAPRGGRPAQADLLPRHDAGVARE